MKCSMFLAATLLALSGREAFAQSEQYMREDCAAFAQSFFDEWEARTEVKTEGQRADGTRPVNGTIFLENRSEDFQCSYNPDGTAVVGFDAEGQSWPDFVTTGKSPHAE